MKKYKVLFFFKVLGIFLLLLSRATLAKEKVSFPSLSCQESLTQAGICPPERCYWACVDSNDPIDRCLKSCFPKSCVQISAKDCPLDRCQLLDACGKTEGDDEAGSNKVCYAKVDQANLTCGGLAYTGQNVECCEGLVKRCGVAFFDGTCDMSGQASIYAVPLCVPCGNGICNQFEDKCNCPEDCG